MRAVRNFFKGILWLLLLNSFFATPALAQGYRKTFGIFGGGPFLEEGCQIVKLNPMPDGRIVGLIRYPRANAHYLISESKPNGLVNFGEVLDNFIEDKNLFGRDLHIASPDTIYVLEDGFPASSGPSAVTLCKYGATYINIGNTLLKKFSAIWRRPLLAANTYAHGFEVLPDGFVSLCSREAANSAGNFDLVLLKTDGYNLELLTVKSLLMFAIVTTA